MKYRKKPVIIEAVKWKGFNENEIFEFTQGKADYCANDCRMFINTLEGTMEASIGDYIIKGINEEFYPCKPNIFEKTYEKVEE
jgi:hypothetical protein